MPKIRKKTAPPAPSPLTTTGVITLDHAEELARRYNLFPELVEHLSSLIKSYDNKELDGWEIEVARKLLQRCGGKP